MDMDSIRSWLVEHKLRAVGTLWASSLIGSFAYNFSQPHMKTSVKLIHARYTSQCSFCFTIYEVLNMFSTENQLSQSLGP
jgi:hypothetical protein